MGGIDLNRLDSLDPGEFLGFTDVLDGDSENVRKIVHDVVGDEANPRQRAVSIFYWVRDRIRYTMYAPFRRREDYRASAILDRGEGYCVQKAVVLATFYRAAGLPAGLIFADIVNHLAPPVAHEFLGTDLFVYHGYVAVYIDGKWLKVTPAFDLDTSEKAGYPLVEFDGVSDAVFPPYDLRGRRFVEYRNVHGIYRDLPLEELLQAWRKTYGEARVRLWEELYKEKIGGGS